MIRTYSKLITLPTFKERFEYLQLDCSVGKDTFGFDRYINQKFYRSYEWKHLRDEVFIRDNGCDLGLADYPIYGPFVIHHMNPINVKDICNVTEYLMNPDYLITTVHSTHNLLHYGRLDKTFETKERSPGDTKLW